MYRIIEGVATLVDENGTPLSTVSGADGPELRVASDLDTTISGGSVSVREQNLDSEGYIKNSSHNMGQYNNQWQPFALDDQNRLRIVTENATHTLSGTTHTGQLSDSQIPSNIIRESELLSVSGSLSSTANSHIADSTIHFTEASIDKYTQSEVDSMIATLSGANSFLNLSDTPTSYIADRYLRTTASGLEFDTEYLENVVYVHPTYSGTSSDGSFSHPFKSIAAAAIYVNANYTDPNDVVVVRLHPGTYVVDHVITITNPALKAIEGTNKRSTTLKPGSSLLGQSFIQVNSPVNTSNVTIDATDNPSFVSTANSTCIDILDDSGREIFLDNVEIRGFYNGLKCHTTAALYSINLSIMQSYEAISLASGVLFDAEMLYIDSCLYSHVHAFAGAEVYIGESELSSAYSAGYTSSGTALFAEGADTLVELFAGTNIWGCNKNIIASSSASVKVDNCVIEDANSNPGIVQESDATLTIVNSRAPLGSDDVSIENPSNFYVNSFDSTEATTVMGNASQADQTLFGIDTGEPNKPVLRYEAAHNTDYRAISFYNPVEGENTEFYVGGNNGLVNLGAHPQGTAAFSSTASLGLVSIQEGVRAGWNIVKETGSTPDLTFKNKNDVTVLTLDYDGNLTLQSGTGVNNILDTDAFSSPNAKTLASTQAIYNFVTGTTYTSTALDSGQLDNRYYTETEIDTISGTLDSNMLYADGSKQLTADWNAGNFRVTASGFDVADMELNLAGYANITGVLTGGNISINSGDSTKLDISAGSAIFVDMADRENPIVEIINWPSQTIDSGLSGIRSKWVGFERLSAGVGTVVTTTSFSQAQKRQVAIIGRYWGQGTTTITGTGKYVTPGFGFGKSMEDIAYALGSLNISGNVYSPTASGSMLLSRTAGESFRFSANYANDNTSPNISNSLTASGITNYQYHVFGALTTSTESTIDPNYYDLDGTKTAVVSGTWTIQRLYYFPVSNTTHLVYGQEYYSDYNEALASLPEYSPNLNTDILNGSILRASLILKEGCTDLTDTNQAVVLEASSSSFGSSGGGTGGVTHHGALTGLLDDDHTQYSLANGSRDYSGVVSYSSHPTFNSDTQLVDKKFVDDSLSSLTTDHGELSGLTDDDHTQYLNTTRGDARYYTQAQVDTISGSISADVSGVLNDLPALQLSKSTSNNLTNTYTSIIWDTQEVENYTDVIEWISGTDVTVKEDGLYFIKYKFVDDNTTSHILESRVLKNGTTPISASVSYHEDAATKDVVDVSFVEILTSGTTLEFQIRSTPSLTYGAGSVFTIVRLRGTKGDQGLTGSGSNLTIEDSGTPVVNTPHSTINFTGAGVSVSDAGSGEVTVDISGATSIFGTEYNTVSSEASSGAASTVPVTKATLVLTAIPAGTYRIGWYYEWQRDSASNDYMARIRINGITTIMEHAQEAKDVVSWHPVSGFYVGELSAGNHNITFDHYGETSSNTSYTRRVRLEIWRIS